MESRDDAMEGGFKHLHLSSSHRGPRRLYDDEQSPSESKLSNIFHSDATEEARESDEKQRVDNYRIGLSTSLPQPDSESTSTQRSGMTRSIRTRTLWIDSPSVDDLNHTASMPDQPTTKHSPRGPLPKKTKLMLKSFSCPEISDVKTKLYKNYTVCRVCGSNSINSVPDSHDGIDLVMTCNDCNDVYGIDDTMTYNDVLALYEKGRFQLNAVCCDNTDVNQFLLVAADATGLQVKCLKCDKVTALGFDLELNAEVDVNYSNQHQKNTLKCRCGNEDFEKMHLFMFKDDVKSISCDICGEFIDIHESAHIGEVPPCNDATLKDNEDYSPFIPCKCKPWKKKIQVDRDATGEINMIACSTCQYTYLPKEQYEQSHKAQSQDPKAAQYRSTGSMANKEESHVQRDQTSQSSKPSTGDDNKPVHFEVRSLSDLQRGDHIMWDRPEGYYHHAIIKEVIQHTGRISVVHYNGPTDRSRKIKGKIAAEMCDPFAKSSGKLFRVDYTKCYEPDVVLKRAYERLGEIRYNFLTNKCEHFATWCKTGERKCYQVISVRECVGKYAWGMGKEVLGDGVRGLLLMAGDTVPIVKQANALLDNPYIGRISQIALAAGEIKQCWEDVTTALEDKEKGLLTSDGCAQIVFKRVARGAGGVIGSNLGCMIPIPVLGRCVGGVLGGLIGEYLGMLAGKGLLHLDDMCGKHIQKRMM